MNKLIDYIKEKILVKIVSLQSVLVLIKVLAGIFVSKAIAILIGPVGLALIGNLRNFTTAFQTVATVGFYNGAVKYISKFKNNQVQLSKTLSTVFYIGFFSTILMSFLCYFNAEFINNIIFPSYNDYAYVIKIFAIVLPFYALNVFLFSIMNGFSKRKILIMINIIGQILSVSIALLLIYRNHIDGALISVVIAEAIIFLITLVGIINRRSLVALIKASHVHFGFLKKMSSFSLMAFFAGVILPLLMIVIRSYIIENIGYEDAGFWVAMTRISRYYLMFITTLMAFYVLPKLSKIHDKKAFKKVVFDFYKAGIPILAIGLYIIYALRPYVVSIIFSEEFSPVEKLFSWQLLGDFIKVLSMVIAYHFLAKKMFWHYVLTEAFLIIILYKTSIYFIDLYHGVEGAVVAHFVSYCMYYAIVLLIFVSSLFGIDSEKKNPN